MYHSFKNGAVFPPVHRSKLSAREQFLILNTLHYSVRGAVFGMMLQKTPSILVVLLWIPSRQELLLFHLTAVQWLLGTNSPERPPLLKQVERFTLHGLYTQLLC